VSTRRKLARLLDGIGVVGALLKLRNVVGLPWLTSLCYHRTAEPVQNGGLAGALADATPAQFDQQLAFLAKYFNFVGVDDIVAFLKDGKKLPPNPVLLSFDDGYRECLTVALPILERHGAKATFFIPTDFIENRRLFWWDRIALAVHGAIGKRDAIELDYPKPLKLSFAGTADAAKSTLIQVVKKTKRLDVERFLRGLESACASELTPETERRLVDDSLMTWEEIARLAQAGMDIGSHTRSHRVLQTLDPAEHEEELRGSRLELEERLGRPVRSIAYPVGYSLGGDQTLRSAVAGAGYDVGFTCRSGVMPTFSKPDALDVPRFLMDVSYDVQHFSAFASVPGLAPRTSIDLT
jgi:peptidoglycan/xylan/chitin deacetylase (PgdA/CDA1 family)